MGKLNTRSLKTKDEIQQRAQKILKGRGVAAFLHTDVGEVEQQWTEQIGKGRPGKHTKYETIVEIIYTLSWRRNKEALDREKKVDGICPILCTDEAVTAKAALEAYKYQPRLEKRFCQLKSVHQVAPTLFKRVERVEAMMLLFFLALSYRPSLKEKFAKQWRPRILMRCLSTLSTGSLITRRRQRYLSDFTIFQITGLLTAVK